MCNTGSINSYEQRAVATTTLHEIATEAVVASIVHAFSFAPPLVLLLASLQAQHDRK
jgi:hypothetical protein